MYIYRIYIIYIHTYTYAVYIYIHIKALSGWCDDGGVCAVGDGGGLGDEYYSRKLFAFSDAIYPPECMRVCVGFSDMHTHIHSHTYTHRRPDVRARAHTHSHASPLHSNIYYAYIVRIVRVCVCVCVFTRRNGVRESETERPSAREFASAGAGSTSGRRQRVVPPPPLASPARTYRMRQCVGHRAGGRTPHPHRRATPAARPR